MNNILEVMTALNALVVSSRVEIPPVLISDLNRYDRESITRRVKADKAREDKAREDKAREDKAREDKAREDKARKRETRIKNILLENQRLKERLALYEPGTSGSADDPINY